MSPQCPLPLLSLPHALTESPPSAAAIFLPRTQPPSRFAAVESHAVPCSRRHLMIFSLIVSQRSPARFVDQLSPPRSQVWVCRPSGLSSESPKVPLESLARGPSPGRGSSWVGARSSPAEHKSYLPGSTRGSRLVEGPQAPARLLLRQVSRRSPHHDPFNYWFFQAL